MKRHGLSSHPLYDLWARIKSKCCNPANHKFPRYGGRGIYMDPQWVSDPAAFIQFARDQGWAQGLQIDRIDNDGPYTPINCRFVDNRTNSRNTSTSKWWFVDGVRYDSASDAAQKLGVSAFAISSWCNGYTHRGVKYPPRNNCYSELKYNT